MTAVRLLLALATALGIALATRGRRRRAAATYALPSYIRNRKVTRSTEDAEGWVVESPANLARQAGGVPVNDDALARTLASEHARGTPLEKASIAHALVNKARQRGWSILRMATTVVYGPRGDKTVWDSGRYGRQNMGRWRTGANRYAATQADPTDADRYIATMVLHGGWPDPTGGADQFLDPQTQRRLHERDPSTWDSVEDKLAQWTSRGDREVYVVPGTDPDRLVFVRDRVA